MQRCRAQHADCDFTARSMNSRSSSCGSSRRPTLVRMLRSSLSFMMAPWINPRRSWRKLVMFVAHTRIPPSSRSWSPTIGAESVSERSSRESWRSARGFQECVAYGATYSKTTRRCAGWRIHSVRVCREPSATVKSFDSRSRCEIDRLGFKSSALASHPQATPWRHRANISRDP